jgi:2-desacetyl-2-hydroxyethyl bacteriochlorophyllide A dehydrogenase
MESYNIVFTAKEKVEIIRQAIVWPDPDKVLIKIEKSLISIGTETRCLRGIFDEGTNWSEWVKYPFLPGYSASGTVISIGENVNGFHVGERVGLAAPHCQYATASPSEIQKLPEGISFEDATWVALALTTQIGVRRAEMKLGETVGVIGLGMLGQLVVQYLVLSGARKVICIDPVQSRLDLALANGATHALNCDARDARTAISEITAGEMLDIVFDITGHPAVLAPAAALVRRLGKVILLGDTTTPSKQYLGPSVLSNSISILGAHVSLAPQAANEFNTWTKPNMTALFFDYIKQSRMRIDQLITNRYSPMEAQKIYGRLLCGSAESIGVIFDWSLLSD